MFGRMMSGVAAAALLFVAGSAAAQDFSATRISDEIRTISADAYQGRYPGTEGERMTLAWLQAQYEAMGLEPGGPDGQWLQPVALKRFTPVEGAASAGWTGPDGQTHDLDVGTDILLRAATNDGVAAITGASLVFAGYGIFAPERSWDDYGDVDVAGKVVVVMSGEPEGERFNGAYDTNYQSGAYKADEAFRRGAVGVITLVAQPADSPAWQRAARFNGRTRTLTPGAADLEFSGSINRDVATQWAMAAGLDPGRLATADDGSFRAIPLEGVILSVKATETSDTLVTHNLLARIPGSERPDETIIYSAHWDHIGVNTEHPGANGDTIFNGAWDNASGTIGVLEMARELSHAPRPKRSIVFAHMAAEEMGLMGSYGYTAHPVYPLETTVADINIDMLPLSGPTRDVPIFGKGQNDLEDRLEVLAAAEGRYVSDDHMPEQGFYYRSDHFPFARMGVPAIMPWHGWDWVDGGMEAGEAAWRARFGAVYHKASDEWSAEMDFTSAVENLTLLYRLGLDLANSRDWPGWKPESEFAIVRARSAAARQ
ncbi:M28 family peptidase [uncultured Brevundimonas sp.]|uniref:M28 family peptidase n=1 Tax=uncultured Brevundimonas sp. TaxID=213418 RepID=UPI0030EE621E|tara:strand:+ start:1849 stop:3474 length:1626 start_codon:yes stop_codon:yes gene_type:complete